MPRRHIIRAFFVFSLLLLDASGLIAAFQLAFWTRFYCAPFAEWFPPIKGIPEFSLYQQSLWALLPLCLLVFAYMRFYREVLLSAYDEFVHVLRGVVLCALLAAATTFGYRQVEYSRLVLALWALYSAAIVYGLREIDKVLFRWLLDRMAGPHHVIVVGGGKAAEAIREMAGRQPFVRMTFADHWPGESRFRTMIKEHRTSEVVLIQGALTSNTILEAAQVCESIDISCQIVPDLLEMRRGEIIFNGFCGVPTFQIRPASLFGANYLVKRAFDVIVSLAVLTVLSIPLAVIAFLIRLDTPGPILFTQDRMGFRGRKFKLFKFRTMIADADAHIEKLKHLSDRPGPVFKMKNDPRVTRVGKWLRLYSLDELPQILNVLRGDMSIVGPRPQVLWEAAHYDDFAKKRLRILPGITGLWQVSGRAALSYEEMINLDVYYLENWSLGLDLKILLRTVPVVFAREGAY